jgi:hypothetical protein
MTSSIGTQSFISMTPQPLTAAQRVQVESRAGVAGVGFWLLGAAGEAYSPTTVRNVDTFANAVALANTYRTLIGGAPQALTYGGVAMGNFVVVDVKASAERIVKGFGGVAPAGGLAIVRAQWTLYAV